MFPLDKITGVGKQALDTYCAAQTDVIWIAVFWACVGAIVALIIFSRFK